MEANVVGLIEIDNGMCCDTRESARHDTPISHTLKCFADIPTEHSPARGYQTRFMRADLAQLESELQSEFERLLVRLFEAGE